MAETLEMERGTFGEKDRQKGIPVALGFPGPWWGQGVPCFGGLLPAASQLVSEGKFHPQITILGDFQFYW